MPTIWYDTPITRTEQIAPNVRRFWLQNPGISFSAGQFITMDLPIGDKRLQRWRSYSIASAPSDGGDLELCIVRSADGLGTSYLFDSCEVGTSIRWKGPDGAFILPETLDKDLVMICTGTGIAPFRSMLREMVHLQVPHRKVHLIFGCRTAEELLYRTEMEELAKNIPDFEYDIALSRQPDWTGYQGYVHQIYQEKYAIARPDVKFMICGWSKMIDDAVAHLIVDMGYERGQVVYELYG